ncbi:hypothetical protein [Streptomyces sp. NPDC047985]|uniref:hypothetical protein n=1 Tax=Streptomyces sp. NPDC047985 TaxID=3155384 RepID=UPI003442C5EF
MSRKQPPPVPVIGASQDSSREAELRAWEERQQQRQQAAEPAPEAAPATVAALAAAPTPAAPVSAVAEVSTRAAAAGYLEMPVFAEPDTIVPEERLEFYSRGIFAVQYAAKANHERAEQQRLIGLGLRLKALKEEELHKTASFETFGDLTDARFGIKKHQANNIIRVLGVAQALEDITTQELKERPLRVLVPILETHSADAVRKTWQEAARHGNVTDTALKEAAIFLGYAPPKIQPVLEVEPSKTKPKTLPSDESERVLNRLRALAAEDLAAAQREAAALQSAVQELVKELTGKLEQ